MKSIQKSKLFKGLLVVASVSVIITTGSAQVITKSPDQGAFWQPLHPNGGTYVYADSFVAPGNDTVVSLGTWLNTQTYDPTTAVTFQVWGSIFNNAVNGPDSGNLLATTTGITGMNGSLSFYSAPTTSSLILTSGDTYWFVATVVGAAGEGVFQVGGHTQNSEGITDNGTFWYSNDPLGKAFDGEAKTPEMAFQVNLAAVPEPETFSLVLGGLASLVAFCRKQS